MRTSALPYGAVGTLLIAAAGNIHIESVNLLTKGRRWKDNSLPISCLDPTPISCGLPFRFLDGLLRSRVGILPWEIDYSTGVAVLSLSFEPQATARKARARSQSVLM